MIRYPPKPTRTGTGNTSWNGNRDRSAQRRFAREVLANAGHQCQYANAHGRCVQTTGLHAHHTQPGNHDPETGLALCRAHHREVDRYAR